MTILETKRLTLRKFELGDAPFILDLFTQPSFVANVADRGLRSEDHAADYLRDRLFPAYAEPGFGFWAVDNRVTGETMGLCGLVKRETLDDVDLGYGFLPPFWGSGYAREAAAATLEHAKRTLKLDRVVAIVSPSNAPSIKILDLLGMRREAGFTMPGEDSPVYLYGIDLAEQRRVERT